MVTPVFLLKTSYMTSYENHLQNLYTVSTFKRKLKYIEFNFGKLLKTINKRTGQVLEIGPGMGEVVAYLNSLGIKRIDIIDNDKQILESVSDSYSIRKAFLTNDITKIDKKLHKYDVIIGIQVLEHMVVDQIPVVIQTIYKHLAPNGEIILVVPNAGNPLGGVERYGDWQHKVSFTEQSIKDMLDFAELKNCELNILGYEIPPTGALNALRVFAQKTLHMLLLIIMIANGGTYFKILTPNIVIRIKKLNNPTSV